MPDKDTDKMLGALVRGKTPEEILGQNGLFKQLTKRLVERALEGAMSDHLDYERHAVEGRNTGNPRNGKTRKTVTTDPGEIELEAAEGSSAGPPRDLQRAQ
jgi:putative transposase